MPLNDSQEAHLVRIKASFAEAVDAKYRKGAVEHGGDLLDNDPIWMLDELIKEAIDLFVYATSLRERLSRL